MRRALLFLATLALFLSTLQAQPVKETALYAVKGADSHFVDRPVDRSRDRIVVTAPEAPFPFEPLEMFVFPNKDFPITKYGAKPGDVKANTAAFAKAMAACNKAGAAVWSSRPANGSPAPSISGATATCIWEKGRRSCSRMT